MCDSSVPAEAIKDVKDHFQSIVVLSFRRIPAAEAIKDVKDHFQAGIDEIFDAALFAEAIKDVKDHFQGCLRKRKISWTFNQHSASGSGGKRPGR